MNKEEIKHELARARTAETTIKNNIIELLEQLVEAEKPKLRHGDFGVCKDRNPRLVIENWEGNLTTGGNTSIREDQSNLGPFPEIIFGNIFDLMKDWGEDFKNFMLKSSYDNRVFFVQTSLLRERAIYLGVEDRGKRVGVYLTESEAKEIWHALGHAIMGPKRKENK